MPPGPRYPTVDRPPGKLALIDEEWEQGLIAELPDAEFHRLTLCNATLVNHAHGNAGQREVSGEGQRLAPAER